MKVRVRCFTGMRRYAPDGKGDFRLELPEGASVEKMLETLGVPPEMRPFIAVNGRQAEAGHRLRDGDGVVVFSLAEGG